MERHGGTQAMESIHVDPVAEWATPGDETGLEEPMWQLSTADGPESYPERPDQPDCMYYLRTGFCGYGSRCRFNHPRYRSMGMGTLRAGGGEYPERAGQPVCQYYMQTGMCKFGASCKYHHPKQAFGSSTPLILNVYGYPLRPGEKECSYYMKTWQCKFGVTCKFHHPQPAAGVPSVYPTTQSPPPQYGVIQGNWPGSYVPGSYGPPMILPQVVHVPSWTPYQGPANSQSAQSSQNYGMQQLSPSATAYTTGSPYASNISQKEHAFPERPGQPECQHYLRTGDCKLGTTCKYHHPPPLAAPMSNIILSPMGLPLRAGAPLCSHYAQNGVCKFGPSCKFDHPMGILSYGPSASDIQVAPYPVGSSIVPPSSSKDADSSQMSPLNT